MSYNVIENELDEISGTSFSRTYRTPTNIAFDADVKFRYELLKSESNPIEVLSSGDLNFTGDRLNASFVIGQGETVDLDGLYYLWVYAESNTNPDISDPTHKYEITYRSKVG